MPSSAQAFSLRPTYTLEAGSSPTRTNARPGVTPRCFRSAICCGKAPSTFAAMARPSMTLSGRGEVKALDDVGANYLDALDGHNGRVRPTLINAFFTGHNHVRINQLAQIQVFRNRIKEINVLLGALVIELVIRRGDEAADRADDAFVLDYPDCRRRGR